MGGKVIAVALLLLSSWGGWSSGGLSAQAGPSNSTYLLVITGLGGEPSYRANFQAAATQIYDAARQWGAADSALIWLAEDPAVDSKRIRGRSTREAVAAAFESLASRVSEGDVVLVVLIGHGGGEGADSRVNLPGPDPVAQDYSRWLGLLSQATVVFVNAASASGDFLPVVSGPRRVVITATRSAVERNESVFATYFAEGLASQQADADKDGRVSVLEAYSYARSRVRNAYESTNRLLTERSLLDDNGDGKGTDDPAALAGDDGSLARRITFGGARLSGDPRIAALQAERRDLELQLERHRLNRSGADSLAWERRMEELLVLIAEKTREIQRLERGGVPES